MILMPRSSCDARFERLADVGAEGGFVLRDAIQLFAIEQMDQTRGHFDFNDMKINTTPPLSLHSAIGTFVLVARLQLLEPCEAYSASRWLCRGQADEGHLPTSNMTVPVTVLKLKLF